MQDLSGIVDDHLSIESRFTYKKPLNLTDSGTELPDDQFQVKRISERENTAAVKGTAGAEHKELDEAADAKD